MSGRPLLPAPREQWARQGGLGVGGGEGEHVRRAPAAAAEERRRGAGAQQHAGLPRALEGGGGTGTPTGCQSKTPKCRTQKKPKTPPKSQVLPNIQSINNYVQNVGFWAKTSLGFWPKNMGDEGHEPHRVKWGLATFCRPPTTAGTNLIIPQHEPLLLPARLGGVLWRTGGEHSTPRDSSLQMTLCAK